MNTETFKHQIFPLKDRMYRLSLSILVNPAEAQDVVQEVLMKFWNQRHRLQEIKSLDAWALKITKNHCLDKLRSKHRRVEDIQMAPVKADGQANAEQLLERKELLEQIQRLMQRLPEKQRMLMQLRDIEGLSYEEIQEVMDLSTSQVKTNLFRARKKMRALIEKTVNYER